MLNKVGQARTNLLKLRDWLLPINNHQELKKFVSDSIRFVDTISPVLRKSAPHLYISALPFIPRDSPLSKSYLLAFPGSIHVDDDDRIKWSEMLLNIETSSKVWSISLSPDGKQIVSGSYKNTWSIWDIETGSLVLGPIQVGDYTDAICCVASSLDGKCVASGSNNSRIIRFWDAQTGEMNSNELIGHTRSIHSLTFSPDGKHLASGSWDSSIRIWSRETGTCVKELINNHDEHTFNIAFSPSGRQIASSSYSQVII